MKRIDRSDRIYSVSICLLIKDENRYLREWLDWHVAAGFDHFFIYDNGSKVPIENSIPAPYRDKCTVVDWSGEHDNIQADAYEHCLANYGRTSQWLAFIDTDEFIRVVDGMDIKTFMADFEIDDVLVVPWVVYNANGQFTRDDRPQRERFTEVSDKYPKRFPSVKCFIRPDMFSRMLAHWPVVDSNARHPVTIVSEKHLRVNGPHDPTVTGEKIVIDHYFTRSWEEWVEKAERGSSCPMSVRKYDLWFDLLNPDLEHPPLKVNGDESHDDRSSP